MNLATAILVVFALAVGVIEAMVPTGETLDVDWKLYQVKFSKQYGYEEEQKRRAIWEANVAKINHHNIEHDMGLHTYTMKVNAFTDMSDEEFASTILMEPISRDEIEKSLANLTTHDQQRETLNYGSSIDLRNYGYVNAIQNQGSCGSCWCFATAASMEGEFKYRTGSLPKVSEQDILDCTKYRSGIQNSCSGGNANFAIDAIVSNGGIDTLASYPYLGYDQGTCKYSSGNSVGKIKGHSAVSNNEATIKGLVSKGYVIIIYMNASPSDFKNYGSGIFNSAQCTNSVNHLMAMIGYGENYYLIRNSWGTGWGEQGYVKMAPGACGLGQYMSYAY